MAHLKTLEKLIDGNGFPLYVYEEEVIAKQVATLQEALPDFEIFYSLKTNPHPQICRFMSRQGLGADAASTGEVRKAADSGFSCRNILYSSPGKTPADIENTLGRALLVADSYNELAMINSIGQKWGERTAVSLRINPAFQIGMGSSPEITAGAASKFGVDEESLLLHRHFIDALEFIEITGIQVFLRSQVLGNDAIYQYFKRVFEIAAFCQEKMGWNLSLIDFGGGFGIPYSPTDQPLDWNTLRPKIRELVARQDFARKEKPRLIVESGRFLVAQAGSFVTQVVDVKTSRRQKFVIVHGGLSGFLRPSVTNLVSLLIASGNIRRSFEPLFTLQSAHLPCIPAKTGEPVEPVTIVGNLCTAMDVMARDVYLPDPQVGDIVYFSNAGAYGYSLSPSDFAGHPRPREIYLNTEGLIAEDFL